MPRRIRVINIDDLNQLDPELYAPFVEVLPIPSELEAQELLARLSVPHRNPVDMLLVDIDMSGNWRYHPKALVWGRDDEGVDASLRPYGPMLAVPFLMSAAEMVFVPYSNWWASPAICENGFVLLSCAFIFSRVYGGVWTLEKTREHIRAHIQPKASTNSAPVPGTQSSVSESTRGNRRAGEGGQLEETGLLHEPEKALRTAMVRLRRLLQKSGSIQFVNVEATCRKLGALDEAGRNHRVPLCDPDTGMPIVIEWVSTSRWEQIEVSSLYADVLDFRTDVDQQRIKRINELVQADFFPLSIANVGTLYDMSKLAFDRCQAPLRLDKVVEGMKNEIQVPLTPDDWQLIKRLAILFAWVKSWWVESKPERRITRVRQFLGFTTGEAGATNTYTRFIRSGDSPTEGKGRWNQPFKRQHKNGTSAEDFKLDIDQAEALSVFESKMCVRFADEELGWLETSPEPLKTYPRWMTQPDETRRAS